MNSDQSTSSGKKRKFDEPPPVGSRAQKVGKVPITMARIREGVLNGDTWVAIFQQNNEVWKSLGGCPLGVGTSSECDPEKVMFNFFPTSLDAEIEWSEETESGDGHVAADPAPGAVVKVAKMPFLKHPETFKRPTLLAFEVTGHVMLGILYNYKGARGPQLHIVNPWSLKESQQLKDVYVLLETTLKKHARNVIVIDVADEIQKTRDPKVINLQEDEKIGFCTLWVGILAGRLIPHLPNLQVAVGEGPEGGQLNLAALQIYKEVYTNLQDELTALVESSRGNYGEGKCVPWAATAMAVKQLADRAAQAKLGGKRKYKRQTKRKPLYRRTWTKKRRNLR
jgi:hypothetical protein